MKAVRAVAVSPALHLAIITTVTYSHIYNVESSTYNTHTYTHTEVIDYTMEYTILES